MGIEDELLVVKNWWQKQRRWAPAAVALLGVIMVIAPGGFIWEGLGCLLMLGAGWWYAQQQLAVQEPPDTELKDRVGKVHEALFMAAGVHVGGFFNDVWRAAGLEERGIPNIMNGKT